MSGRRNTPGVSLLELRQHVVQFFYCLNYNSYGKFNSKSKRYDLSWNCRGYKEKTWCYLIIHICANISIFFLCLFKNYAFLCNVQHSYTQMQVVNLHIACRLFLWPHLRYLGAIVPPCEVLMYSQHLCNVLNSGKGDGTFYLLLLCSTITQIKSSNITEVLLPSRKVIM